MTAVVDLTGKRIGGMQVIRRAGSNEHGRALWLCRCECGTEVVRVGKYLQRSKNPSCGCKFGPPRKEKPQYLERRVPVEAMARNLATTKWG